MRELTEYLEFFIIYIPGQLGQIIRGKYYSLYMACGENLRVDVDVTFTGRKNISMGNNVLIMKNSYIHSTEAKVTIGNNFNLNTNSYIDADFGTIIIGNDVIIAQNVVLRAADHAHDSLSVPIRYQGYLGGEIVIGNGVWIGANCVITRNVKIGDHSIVGAGAVVTKDVEPFTDTPLDL
ncbi:MAG: acyltransferase [Nitrospina sp.]|jgi:galactoside O-acetyltransferase|nr:acyltransferase [Nitrospina sp.]MBT4049140.1 acyltransferase [Nitrospina sp.]MBT4557697.1 acyltransferase [Nitrospina sp.]MBT6739627.1 acyltransferase [Nitrospina sp.]MBT7198813.1 acyltransferase [Nitrospina sp.]